MTSDVNGTVVAIQGVEVNSIAPTDGYVLTYDGTDGYWIPKPISSGFNKDYFTSSGTWTAPAGITNVLVIGCGGGGGGAGGGSSNSGYTDVPGGGGGGALQQTAYVSVTPGNTYTITIGAGGTGGSGGTSSNPGNYGSDGASTTMTISSTIYFSALGGGGAGIIASGGEPTNFMSGAPGLCFSGYQGVSYLSNQNFNSGNWSGSSPAMGGIGMQPYSYNDGLSSAGLQNLMGGYSGGSAGNSISGLFGGGGGGGGAGPQGAGGNGGNGSTGSAGSNGSNAAVNTGAGGGGGGSGYGNNGGNGGSGGSGYLYIIW